MKVSKLKNEVLNYLISEPKFRNRRAKNRGIANMMIKTHLSVRDVPKEVMEEIVTEILSADRFWRMIMADRKDLQSGTDYNTKKVIMQEKMLELGVAEMGYNVLIKTQ